MALAWREVWDRKVFLEEAATAKSSKADCAKGTGVTGISYFHRSRAVNVMCLCGSALLVSGTETSRVLRLCLRDCLMKV